MQRAITIHHMRFRFLLVAIFCLMLAKVSYSQNLVAQNNTFVMLTIGAPESVGRHTIAQYFLLNEGDSIAVKTDSLQCFLSSIYQQSKRVPACSLGFEQYLYFQLWGATDSIYKASLEFSWDFSDDIENYKSSYEFKLNDGTPIIAEYLDLSAIYYVDEGEHACSIEFKIPKEENVKEAWRIVAVVACKKSRQHPIHFVTNPQAVL